MAARTLDALDALGRRRTLGLALVLALALVVRVAAVAATPGYEPFSDAQDYERHAVSIAAGDGFPPSIIALGSEQTAIRPPVYPLVLGGVYAATGDSRTAGRLLIGAGGGTLLVLLLFLLAERVWGRRVAFATAITAALFPPLVLLTIPLLNEPTFLVLEVAAVLTTLLATRSSGPLRWAAATGVLCGLAMLTRSNGTLMPLLLGVPMALAFGPGIRRFAASALMLAAVALTLVPWTVRNERVFGDFVPLNTQTGYAAAGVMNDESRGREGQWGVPAASARYRALYLDRSLDEADVDRKVRRLAVEYAVDHPAYVAKVAGLSVLRSLELMDSDLSSPDRRMLGLGAGAAELVRWSFYLALVAAAYGALALKRRHLPERGPLWIWVVPLALFVAGATVVGLARYRAPLYPFVALLAAIGVVAWCERSVSRRRRPAGS